MSDYWDLTDEITFGGWASGDNREGEWTYFWAQCERPEDDSPDASRIWYRVSRLGGTLSDWKPALPSAEVFAKTGFVDDEPEDGDGPLGDAERLPAGHYILDFKVEFQGEVREFHGVKFEVAKRK